MVVLKGGGQTYVIGNGRQVPWEEVPASFKEKLQEQKEIQKCVSLRSEAQECIEDRGFWDPVCVEATERFHLCQSLELSSGLQQRGEGEASKIALQGGSAAT